MSFSAAAATGFVVLFLSVTVGKDEPAWSVKYDPSQICAFIGSTVTIKCSYKYPSIIHGIKTEVKKRFWFTKLNNRVPVNLMKDSDYKGRITYNFTESSSSSSFLTIKDLKQRDSAEYKFRFITNRPGGEFTGSPGVTLTVLDPDLRVQVRRSETQTELKCESSCDQIKPPSYVWFNKEKKMEQQTSAIVVSVRDGGRYSCSVKGHDDLRSPSVYAPESLSAKLMSSGQITEGRSVTLSCSSDANPAAEYTWRKNNNQSVVSKDQQFILSSILSSDSGQYYCTAQNQLGEKTSGLVSVQVTYAPRPPSVSVTPSGEIMEGSLVTLNCSSDANPAAKYTWRKKNNQSVVSKDQQFILSSILSSDSGQYYCTAQNQLGEKTSGLVSVQVTYAPRPPSVSVTPSGEIMEGSLVTLSCSSDANPAANYSWYKEGEEAPKASGQNFTITNILFKQRGNYYCEAQNSRGRCNSTVTVNVVAAPRNRVAAAAAVSAVLLILILICLLVWLIKPKVWKQQSRPGAGPVPSEQVNSAEESVVYSVVHLATKQEEPLYCNTVQLGPTRPKRHKKRKEEETVEYVSVNCGRTRTDARTESEQQDSVEDPAALYSKVNKPGKNSRETPAGF
ncbi:B-cell receptor CD22-like isoform X2 [Xiphophorus maculatus]|uniref:B-cell receptor CD22-like isoform X2 n=1 Tax=Xiphophorus maculatus TaxID=8083 RepID=UPI000C6D285F|nr:B-cell receptor CD22-like isoform X2 [Xiphophorus maculatus]